MAGVSARDRILAAALTIVATDGVGAVSNRRIAAQAKVSLGSITYHFPTQSDLLQEALLGYASKETVRMQELAEQYRDTTIDLAHAAQITARIAQDFSFTEVQFATFELYLHAGRDRSLRGAAGECFAAYDKLTVSILEALGVPNAEQLAPTLVATITGLQLRRLATGSKDDDISAALIALLAR
ncbi:TetR/AcrR family transcriptional regulator [Antrihabitans cavernicola]|uniref:TetR family transcriptional regulator n=1 Tax=Antrihabitans cavernicola TaxID=2495913 RepID=A0A5A7SEE0_9NOCA|nr:TetR/AcrR family transcriptional regulator [Spelaeibacter cavernicola]KAA0022993.1 TetR family transcriptional regulator [Spelaeibacter cavernicola]